MTDETFEWDEVRVGGGDYGDFFSFKTPGDRFVGNVTGKRKPKALQKDKDKPVYVLDAENTTGKWTISLENVDLLAKCKEAKVEVGDRIQIEFTGYEKLEGMANPMKVYEVATKKQEPAEDFSEDPF